MKKIFFILAIVITFLTSMFFLNFQKLKKPVVVILLGQPASGKGTLASNLKKEINLPHISTGELFVKNIEKETDLGKKAKVFMDKGDLVPDQIVFDMLFKYIDESGFKKGYILDGFPRTLEQARILDKRFSEKTKVVVIDMNVADDVLIERIQGRLICKDCKKPYHSKFFPPIEENVCDNCQGVLEKRSDDNLETFKKRLVNYHNLTEPVLKYYKDQNLLFQLDSKNSSDKNCKDIVIHVQKSRISK